MGGSLSADLVGGLSEGLSEEDANKLWQQCDKKQTGVLDRAQAKQLVQLLADDTCKKLSEKIEKLQEARKDGAQVDAFLNAFDISGDGKVEKYEFIKKAMEGYEIHVDDDEQAEDEEAEEAVKEGVPQKFEDCEEPAEPPKKKARVEEKAPEASAQAGAGKELQEVLKKRMEVAEGSKEGSFKPGDKVKIVNVTKPSGVAFNGMVGEVKSWNAQRGRWNVKMPPIVVPTAVENMEPVAAAK
uniref:EF-hand domain-containing protein n=1 Tax=Alexandrium catenella TaxID=2925 RepID=A0A7S1L1J4_ALECA